MPLNRRKTPFSAKKKKAQLLERRRRKAEQLGDSEEEAYKAQKSKKKIPPSVGGKYTRYALRFHAESRKEIQKRKEMAYTTIVPVPLSDSEINVDDYFPPDFDFPKRPPWNYEMSKEALEAQEHKYFSEYVTFLEKNYSFTELTYFELNLETWRQLWRVLEMSDIVLLIVDIRYSALMFPPSLYDFVVNKLKKNMILVLNKIDLAPAPLVLAWKYYFLGKFPSLKIVSFTSIPTYNLHGNLDPKKGLQNKKRRIKLRMAAEGAQRLLEACEQIVNDEVDLSSWKRKINEEMMTEYEDEDEISIEHTYEQKKVDTSFVEHVKYRDGVLTIGCVGQPNVGKSSLLNAVMGKKVVSVSRTPGHTKHFQTIFLTKNVRLCDCPGLVFPSSVPKILQVLMGSYPIAQLREPYTSIKYLAERIDLVRILNLKHPEGDLEWSAMDICDAWAKARGYTTARTARPDSYRAANHLLRLTLEGKICLCLRPVGYTKKEEFWAQHAELKEILWLQARNESLGDSVHSTRHQKEFILTDSEDEVGPAGESDSDDSCEYDDSTTSEESSEELPITNKFAMLYTDD